MSFQVLATPTLTQNANHKPDGNRHLANFQPSIWEDYFRSRASETVENDDAVKLVELKGEIQRMLMADGNKPSQTLEFIDEIQHLGVSYHFEGEINEILEKIHNAKHDYDLREDDDNDLYSISLRFRLLRQHGYKTSSDVFNKFKDSNGNFKPSLVTDIRGMLSLYEAAHLRMNGDNILDEALAFTITTLEPLAIQSNFPLAEQIARALNRPIRKSLPRKSTRKKLSDIIRWWRGFDVPRKLPFVRDRIVELYFWILGIYYEPQYRLARKMLTKVIAMTSIIDDIYDAYGTLEELELFTKELELFTKAIERALLDVYNEFENDLATQGSLYGLSYAIEAMKRQVRNYMIEARWCDQQYIPTIEQYMDIAFLSCGHLVMSISSFLGMGDIATKEAFEWVSENPKIVNASSVICRLMDDIVSHKFEQKRGHVASSVECYMKQHGVSEEETVKVLSKQVANAWKYINEEFLRPTAVPMPLLERILNLLRVMDLLYKDHDCYTNSHLMKDHVVALLKDPVLL